MNLNEESIVFFDGVCGLCNKSVNWLMRRDKRKRLKFAPLQGDTSDRVLDLEGDDYKTIIFYDRGETYYRSTAFIKIMVRIGGGWTLMYGLMIFPGFIRDFFYNIISRNRYKWFGKLDACRLPTEEEEPLFMP